MSRFVRWLVPVVAAAPWAVVLAAAGSAKPTPFFQPTAPLPAKAAVPADPGPPGKTLELWVDRASGVTSAWLSNGILLHHKQLTIERPKPSGAEADRAPDGADGRRRDRPIPEVAVCVTIAGAELLETAENRGVSDAAVAAAWSIKSVKSMKAGELGAYLQECGASIRGFGGADSFMLTATMEAAKVEPALRALRLLLSEPLVDDAELAKWRDQTIKQIEQRQQAGNDGFGPVIEALFGPQEARARRPLVENIRAITAEQAQAWLDTAIGAGKQGARGMPMEVAIVGEVPVDRAIRLAEVYLASLPERDRMAEATLADRRVATRAQRPPEVMSVANWKGPPLVLAGFFGADIKDIADHRALAVAAKILSNRLDRLPPEQNDANRAFAQAIPASVYPGFGLFFAVTHPREGNEAAASENIHKLLTDVMQNGPSAEELSAANQDLSSSAARMLADPVYWARTLSRSAYHGVRLPEIGVADRTYRDMPAETVKSTLSKYWTPERSIKLIVKPGEEKKDAAKER